MTRLSSAQGVALVRAALAAAPSSPSVSPQCRVSPGGCRCARPVVVLVDDATGGGPWCAVHVPDEVAIARRVSGDQSVRLMPHELVEAVRRMCVSGEPERVVADRLGIAPRSVSRIRADHALPASRPKASSSRLGVAS